MISLGLIIAAVIIVITIIMPLVSKGDVDNSGTLPPQESETLTPDETGVPGETTPPSTEEPGGETVPPEQTATSFSLDKTEFSFSNTYPYPVTVQVTYLPAGSTGSVTWTSSDPDIATVDEYGNIANVYKGSNQVSVTITASAGGQTATCTVTCTGDGTGEDIVPSGGASTGGQTGGALAPNTDAVITGATGGLNIRSGPGTDYTVQASTQDGATVTVLGDAGNGWYHIRYATGGGNFEEGYVMGDYLAPSPVQN